MSIHKFELPCELQTFFCHFWQKTDFFSDFLKAQGDIDVILRPWEPQEEKNSFVLSRSLECSHPVKVSFPGTPSHSRCFRSQTIKVEKNSQDPSLLSLTVLETMRIEGIPYSDYFTVETVWKAVEHRDKNPTNTGLLEAGLQATPAATVSVEVFVVVQFAKSTWLKGTISSNAESECKEACVLWQEFAGKRLAAGASSAPALGGVVMAEASTGGSGSLASAASPHPSWFTHLLTAPQAVAAVTASAKINDGSGAGGGRHSDGGTGSAGLLATPPSSSSRPSGLPQTQSRPSANSLAAMRPSGSSSSMLVRTPFGSDHSDNDNSVGDSDADGAEFFDADFEAEDGTSSVLSGDGGGSGGGLWGGGFMEDVERARNGTYRGYSLADGSPQLQPQSYPGGGAASSPEYGSQQPQEEEESGRVLKEALVVVAEFALWQASTVDVVASLGSPYFSPKPGTVLRRLARALLPTPLAIAASCGGKPPCPQGGGGSSGGGGGGMPQQSQQQQQQRFPSSSLASSFTARVNHGRAGLEEEREYDTEEGDMEHDERETLLSPSPPLSSSSSPPPPSSLLLTAAGEEDAADLFGPVMAVLSLAQVLLWCIDVTGDTHPHAHCSRETLLGTSLLVAVSSWAGAALWYFLVSYLLGARLRLVHSFSAAGYASFGWSLALVVSQLLVLLRQRERALVDASLETPREQDSTEAGGSGGNGSGSGAENLEIQHDHHQLEVYLAGLDWAAAALSDGPEWALLALGLPSGAALALVFANATPSRFVKSSRSLVDDDNAAAAAASGGGGDVVRASYRKARACGLSVRRVLCTAWPRALCFVLVLVTHVELLRYLHHVVIPGEQLLCAVW